jgi:hypothetical protein
MDVQQNTKVPVPVFIYARQINKFIPMLLKGTLVTIYSTAGFFLYQTIPSGHLIHGLMPFRIWLQILEGTGTGIRQSR